MFLLSFIFLISTFNLVAQTKVSGYVYDEFNDPVSFVNVFFKDSSEGTSTNENGKFYLESDQNWDTLIISFIGYKNQEIGQKIQESCRSSVEVRDQLPSTFSTAQCTAGVQPQVRPGVSVVDQRAMRCRVFQT